MRKRRDNRSFRRELIVRGVVYGTLALLVFAAAVSSEPSQRQITLRDIAHIEGKPAKLSGFGLVVGLNGTGDGSILGHTERTLRAALGHLGIDTRDERIGVGEVAAVLVQAELPAGTEPGTRVPVQITALGDTRDLAGGRLVPLTLHSRDGRFTGEAEGVISEGCSRPLGAAPASAFLSRGLVSSSSVFMNEVPDQSFVIEVRGLDPRRVEQLAALINMRFGQIANTHTGCDIEIKLSDAYADFNNRAGIVLQIASLPVGEIVPELLVNRDSVNRLAQ
jgi:flagellar P-ring protein precursor FlgI